MELNKYSLYSMNLGNVETIDKVDSYIREIKTIREYDAIKDYIDSKFGTLQEEVTILDYPELDKKMSIVLKENLVEICAVKGDKQFFGRSWRFVTKEED